MTFTACIQRYRIIDLIIRAVRHFFIATVYGRTRRINTLIYYYLLYSFIVFFTTSSQLYFSQIKSAA